MEHITVRSASVNLPDFPEDVELTPLSSLNQATGEVSWFSLDNLSVRALELRDVGLREGKIHAARAESVSFRRVTARSLKFSACNLSMLRWSDGEILTTWFDNCKVLGGRFDNLNLAHVTFSDCMLDYCTFSRMRTPGPVIFVRCSFREADFENCHLPNAVFDECKLIQTNFDHGNYRGCDLRGNDLSLVTGINNLKSVTIDRHQVIQLGEAMASELNVTFSDDLQAE